MNSLKKRLISLLLLTSMALSSFAGCSDNNKSSKEKDSSGSGSSQEEQTANGSETNKSTDAENTTIDIFKDFPLELVTGEKGELIKIPMQSGEIGSAGGESNGNGLNLGGQDPESVDISPSIPSGGQSSTKPVDVTDAQGEKVTDSSGQTVTEYVTENGGNSDYKSVTNGNYVLWIDCSLDEDFVFNGEFIKVTFEVKDGIPDGEYPITFVTDFSSVKGVITNPKIYSGSITVGGDAKKGEDHSNETDFILYGDNISCKQGDTVDFYINTKNNPGLAATLLWFYYDSNAMTVKANGVKPAGEFAEISSRVDSNA